MYSFKAAVWVEQLQNHSNRARTYLMPWEWEGVGRSFCVRLSCYGWSVIKQLVAYTFRHMSIKIKSSFSRQI